MEKWWEVSEKKQKTGKGTMGGKGAKGKNERRVCLPWRKEMKKVTFLLCLVM